MAIEKAKRFRGHSGIMESCMFAVEWVQKVSPWLKAADKEIQWHIWWIRLKERLIYKYTVNFFSLHRRRERYIICTIWRICHQHFSNYLKARSTCHTPLTQGKLKTKIYCKTIVFSIGLAIFLHYPPPPCLTKKMKERGKIPSLQKETWTNIFKRYQISHTCLRTSQWATTLYFTGPLYHDTCLKNEWTALWCGAFKFDTFVPIFNRSISNLAKLFNSLADL